MKRVALGVVIVVAALFATVLGVGMLLPVNHVATVKAEYSAGAEDVFEAIFDYRAHPQWRPSVERIELLQARDGKPAWQEIGSSGPLPMELIESDPPRRMVTAILSEGMPFGGRWIYEIQPTADGAALTITEEGEVYNLIFRFVSRFIIGHHKTASTYLEDLGRKLRDDDVVVEVLR